MHPTRAVGRAHPGSSKGLSPQRLGRPLGRRKLSNAPHQLQGAARSGNPTARRLGVPALPQPDGRALTAACDSYTAPSLRVARNAPYSSKASSISRGKRAALSGKRSRAKKVLFMVAY